MLSGHGSPRYVTEKLGAASTKFAAIVRRQTRSPETDPAVAADRPLSASVRVHASPPRLRSDERLPHWKTAAAHADRVPSLAWEPLSIHMPASSPRSPGAGATASCEHPPAGRSPRPMHFVKLQLTVWLGLKSQVSVDRRLHTLEP